MNNCVEWSGGRQSRGYGVAWIDRKPFLAHRVAYCLANGIDISEIDGLVVRHTCDNPPCVNPDHLLIGTQADNMRDCVTRGRKASQAGSRHSQARLTESDVKIIREEYRDKQATQPELAKRFGVANNTINYVINRKSWGHVS